MIRRNFYGKKDPRNKTKKISKMLIEEYQPESLQEALKDRGLEDVLILSAHNLSGFIKAIESVYPKSEIQKCIYTKTINKIYHLKKWKVYLTLGTKMIILYVKLACHLMGGN